MTSKLKNVHLGLLSLGSAPVTLIKGDYEYWHYCCDSFDDRGWGCGYRTLQTVCSWIRLQHQHKQKPEPHVLGGSNPHHYTHCTKNFGSDVISVIASGDISSDGDTISDETRDVCNVVVSDRNNAHIAFMACGYEDTTQNSKASLSAQKSSSNSAEEITDNMELSSAKTDRLSGKCISVAVGASQDSHDIECDSSGISVVSSGNQNSTEDRPSVLSITIDKRDQSQVDSTVVRDVPSLLEIQKALFQMGDKPGHFVGSSQWIGSYEVCLCLDFFYNVPCKIVHIKQGADLRQHLSTLQTHFSTLGSPVMMGGETDASSKGIMGVCVDPAALLVVDPHYSGKPKNIEYLQKAGWIKWILLEDFHQTSFYNICLPQLAARLAG